MKLFLDYWQYTANKLSFTCDVTSSSFTVLYFAWEEWCASLKQQHLNNTVSTINTLTFHKQWIQIIHDDKYTCRRSFDDIDCKRWLNIDKNFTRNAVYKNYSWQMIANYTLRAHNVKPNKDSGVEYPIDLNRIIRSSAITLHCTQDTIR